MENISADAVHWYDAYNPFVGAETLKAIAACPAASGLGPIRPVDAEFPSEFRPGRNEAALILNHAAAFLFLDHASKLNNPLAAALPRTNAVKRFNPRVLALLSKADRTDRTLLLSALRSREALGRELKGNRWVYGIKLGMDRFVPELLAHAAETYRRAGATALAREFRLAAERGRERREIRGI